ncbi:hypothetical protein AB0M20_21005 [Actinoplanes sp. NPDC051633]|uniref:hypothetical protein n=1 Tax=Actinoplanes sp. NPDC051633 TaxID=3155670 RepID=UPI00343D464B
MLDAGSGNGYAGTNWNGMSMYDMWLTVGNQDTTPHWELLTGWRKSYELTLQHMSAVKSYRDNLAAAWPPEKSEAAAAYAARLDQLIDHLQQTYDAAVANHDAFSGATLALSSARRELEPLVNEYLANEQKLVVYQQELASPPPVGEDAIAPPVQNPVAAGRQAELKAKAVSLMSGLSAELTTARTQLRKPKPYDTEVVDDSRADDGGPVYVPPTIPPVTPIDPSSGAHSSVGATSSHHAGVAQPPSASHAPAQGRLPGLVLGGTQPPVVAPPAASPINPPIVGGPSSTAITPIAPVAPIKPGLTPGRTPLAPGSSKPGAPAAGPRALPSGGVIGARPGSGVAQPATGRMPGNVNPVGGVIGPNQPVAGRTGAGAGHGGVTGGRPTSQPFGMMPGQTPRSSDESSTSRKWDPDNPWVTDKGVDPVLLPPEDPKIDPGPAIGLS